MRSRSSTGNGCQLPGLSLHEPVTSGPASAATTASEIASFQSFTFSAFRAISNSCQMFLQHRSRASGFPQELFLEGAGFPLPTASFPKTAGDTVLPAEAVGLRTYTNPMFATQLKEDRCRNARKGFANGQNSGWRFTQEG
jgi:hypothetical protein